MIKYNCKIVDFRNEKSEYSETGNFNYDKSNRLTKSKIQGRSGDIVTSKETIRIKYDKTSNKVEENISTLLKQTDGKIMKNSVVKNMYKYCYDDSNELVIEQTKYYKYDDKEFGEPKIILTTKNEKSCPDYKIKFIYDDEDRLIKKECFSGGHNKKLFYT